MINFDIKNIEWKKHFLEFKNIYCKCFAYYMYKYKKNNYKIMLTYKIFHLKLLMQFKFPNIKIIIRFNIYDRYNKKYFNRLKFYFSIT